MGLYLGSNKKSLSSSVIKIGGVDTSDATATSEDILSGKTAYVNDERVTGSFTLDTELTEQDNLISQLGAILDEKSAGGGVSIDTCTIRLVCNESKIYSYSYLSYKDGVFSPVTMTNEGSAQALDVTLTDVICAGHIYIQTAIHRSFALTNITGNATTEVINAESGYRSAILVYAPNEAGSTSTVTIVDDE